MSLESRRTNRISVVGAVEQPGSYELPVAGSDLLSALIAAGGLSDDADHIIEIRLPAQPTPTILPAGTPTISPTGNGQVPIEVARTSYDSSTGQHPPQTLGPRSVRLDLVAATTSPQSQDYRLDDGAIVMVRKLPPRYVHVIGLVQKPNRFELPPGEDVRILDAIAMAQGLKISLADRAYVIRQIPNAAEPVVVEVSIRKAKTTPADNILLTDGDVVSVEETPLTFVFGTLKNVVRIGLTSSLSLF
jgi:polysaccharide export outer membrane protein